MIVFSEVMFNETMSGENPQHIEFVTKIAKPLFESWGYEVIILHSGQTYMDIFNHVIKHPRKHADHAGKRYGFAVTGFCSIKRDLKLKPIQQFYQSLGEEPYIQYVGLCIDEPERLTSMHKDSTKISLLEKYQYTEQMAKELCEEYGLLSPVYELSKRGGCWFCPHAKLEEHKYIFKNYPDVWSSFVALEDEPDLANDKWNVYGQSLKERDLILKEIENIHQITMFDYFEH